MEIENIFGKITDADWNGEDTGFLNVHCYSGQDVHVWFDDPSQLGDLHIDDVMNFKVLPLNNKALNNSYKLISFGDNQNTIATLLKNNMLG